MTYEQQQCTGGVTGGVSDAAAALVPRIELVDNWHAHWPQVLELVDRGGYRQTLHIDADGWLSARQNLLVAFIGADPVGQLCFRVQPVEDAGHHVVFDGDGKAAVEAYVECFSVDEVHASQGVGHLLIDRARARAVELRCQNFRMESAGAC
ncbi:MAG TPA: GNAT family N-acetyltransferase [Tepidisphaeraceae bacterium]|nr:GNAT family N-acetyltransferase [Tepidisphaeraceae bacterium]